MAKKVILKDLDNSEMMPVTRGELIVDSLGNPAFSSNLFLATQSLPGLMSGEDKTKLDSLDQINGDDKKVELVNTTTNDSYRLLFSNSADDETKTEGARKSAKLLFNPSTGALTATTLIGKLDWSNLNNVPEEFTPTQHIHNTSEITALTSYSKASSASDLVTTDTLNVALGKLEYKADTAYTWYKSITDTDTDDIINKWSEVVDFVNNLEDDVLETFVTTNTKQTITGEKTFSGTSASLLNIDRNSTNPAWIRFLKNGTLLGYLGVNNDNKALFNNGSNTYDILHSGNSHIKSGVITINGATITPITSHQSLSNYVTLTGNQEISGVKTFTTQQKFTVAQGTSPFTVTSKTTVANLSAALLDGTSKGDLLTGFANVNTTDNPNSVSVTVGGTTKYLKVAYSDLAGKVVCSSSTNNIDRPIVVTNTSNGVYYSTKVTLNYSTGNVTAPTFTGALIGNANTATTASKLSTVSKTAWGLTYWTSGGVPTSISGDMTGVGNITITSGNNVDRFITFDTASTRSWRIGYLGSGSGDANYLAFQSTKTLTTADGWHDMLKIGCETGNATFTGQLTAKNFVSGDGINDFSAGTVKLDTLNIPTSSGGTTFGPGSNGQVLKSNGTTVYWGSDNNSDITISDPGTGNAITGLSASGHTITVTKGNFAPVGTVVFTPASGELTPSDVLDITGGWSIRKGSWNYASNGYIVAGSFGNIDLAGTSVLTFGSSSAYTQLYITAPSQSGHSGKINEIFFYNNHGSNYNPSWTRVITNRNYTEYVSNMYWANVKVSSSSSETTTPTFATATATTQVTTPKVHSSGHLTLNATSTGLYLKFDNTNAKSVILNGTAFKPFDDANGKLDLGTSAARWKGLYAGTGNFIGDVGSTISTGDAVKHAVTNTNGSVELLVHTNRGLYDRTNSKWIIYVPNGTSKVLVPTWANKGGSTTPVYFNASGEPVTCTAYSGLLTALSSSSSTNLSITVGGTTKSITNTYATNITLISCFNGTTNNDLWSTIKTGNSTYLGTANIYEVYNDGGPTTCGEVLDIVSTHANHWLSLLWFGSGKAGHLYYRNKDYNDATWGSWRTILDTGNYSSYLGYIGTTAVLKSSAAQALTGITNATLSGKLTFTTCETTASISFLNGEFIDGYGNVLLGTDSASWHVFNSSRSSLIAVLKSGNVGIGTTSPSYKLHVTGSGYFSGNIIVGGNQYVSDSRYGINMLNSDIALINSLYFADLADTSTEGIHFYRSTTTWDTLTAKNGILYFSGNRAISDNTLTPVFSALANSGNNISITIGGQNRTLTPAYATKAGDADTLDGYHAGSFLLRGRMTNPSNGTSYHGAIPYAIALKAAGTPVYTDPEFASGTNSVSVYNNYVNSTVAISRIADNQGSANSSGYILQIVNNGGTSAPGRGGFYQNISARQNAVFAQIFRAKIPTGFSVVNGENSMGSGYTTFWLTDTAGTGKWEWYIRITICGNGGTYSEGGHVYLNGSGAVTWYLAYCNLIDLTKGNYDGLRAKYCEHSSTVTVNNSDANSTYRMVWHSGNTLYGTAGIYCNPSTDCLYASHYYETSDIAFKTNIKPILNSDNIPVLKSFDWKSDGSHSYGLIALELEAMGYPELVSEGDGYKTVNYSAALSLIVGKLQVKIKELEKEIEILKK